MATSTPPTPPPVVAQAVAEAEREEVEALREVQDSNRAYYGLVSQQATLSHVLYLERERDLDERCRKAETRLWQARKVRIHAHHTLRDHWRGIQA